MQFCSSFKLTLKKKKIYDWGREGTSDIWGGGITLVRINILKVHLKQIGRMRPNGDYHSPAVTGAVELRSSGPLPNLCWRPAPPFSPPRCPSSEEHRVLSTPPKLQSQVRPEAQPKAQPPPGGPKRL